MLLKLSCGKLPWEEDTPEGLRPPKSQAEEKKAAKARLRQKEVAPSKLCAEIADSGLRKAVTKILTEARGMDAEDKPRYDEFRALFMCSAADTKAGQAELQQLEADTGGTSSATGGSAPQRPPVPKKRPVSTNRGAAVANTAAVKSKRAASVKLLRRGGALSAAPASADATSNGRAGTAASRRRKASAGSQPTAAASPTVKRTSGRLSQKSPGAISKKTKRHSVAPKQRLRNTSWAAEAAVSGESSNDSTAIEAVRALSALCADAKGRVTEDLRSEIATQMLRVKDLASAGDALADSAVSVVAIV